jgi:hypothetical protein
MVFKMLLFLSLLPYCNNSFSITIKLTEKSKRKPSSINRQLKVFDSYLSCSELLKVKRLAAFDKCIKNFIDPNLKNNLLYKFKEFLFLDTDVSTAFQCNGEVSTFYKAKKKSPAYFVCFEITVEGKTSIGTAFFLKKTNQFYMYKIKY